MAVKLKSLGKALTQTTKKVTQNSTASTKTTDDLLGNSTYYNNQSTAVKPSRQVTNSPSAEYQAVQAEKAASNGVSYDAKTGSIGSGSNPNQVVKSSTATPAGTKTTASAATATETAATETAATKTTQVNAVKTTKSNSLGKVLGVSTLAAGTAVAGYSLVSSLSKSSNLSGDNDNTQTENPNDGNQLPGGNQYNPYRPVGEELVGGPGESSNGDGSSWYSGGGDGYYYDGSTTSDDGNSIGETISDFISAASGYAPYIIAGIAGLVLLYLVTKKGGKGKGNAKTLAVNKAAKTGVKHGRS